MNILLEWRINRAKKAFLADDITPMERRARWNKYRELLQAKNRSHPREQEVRL